MKIPIEQIKALMNSLGNILILAEEDKLTEQCGVNTSNSFNTPPMDDYVAKPFTEPKVIPGVGRTQTPRLFTTASEEDEDEVIPALGKTQTPDPKEKSELNAQIWKCKSPEEPVLIFPMPSEEEALAMIKDMAAKLDKASRLTDEDISKMCGEVAANVASGESHEDEEEPKLFRVECAIRNSFEVTAASAELAQDAVEGSSWDDLLSGGEPGGADFHYSVKAMESEEGGEPDSYYELDPETRELVRREKPRGADPVERLLDYISEAFTDEHCQTRPSNDTKNWYPDGVSQLCAPSHLHHLADAAQDFLDKERIRKNKTD